MGPLPALVAFLVFIFSTAMVCAYPLAAAAATAIILNLPLSSGVRFLILIAAVWGYWTLVALHDIQRHLERQGRWIRLTFITNHIRNEANGLPGAQDRLKSDLVDERIEKGFEDNPEVWAPLIGLAAFLVILAVMLHFGLFGDVGAGWLPRLLRMFPLLGKLN